jgi:hypothetical protein
VNGEKLKKSGYHRGETQRKPIMLSGDKSSYTGKQKRQAEQLATSCERHGAGEKTAATRAWAAVNELTGGGKLSGAGRTPS